MSTVPRDPTVTLLQAPTLSKKSAFTGTGQIDTNTPNQLGIEPEPPLTGLGPGGSGGVPYQPNVISPTPVA